MSDAPQIGPRIGPQTGAAPLTASKAASATASRGPNRRRTRGGRQNAGISMIEITALVLSLGWLGLVGWYFLTLDDDQGRLIRGNPSGFMIAVLGIFLPVALIWVAASVARTAQTMREESARLQAAIDTIRLSHLDQQAADAATLKRDLGTQIEQVARAQAVLGAEVASLHRPKAPDAILSPPIRPLPQLLLQPALALDTEPEDEALPPDDFIRAMNFPENERDAEGFRVLRSALKHHRTAQLVTAAQDLLTLLAQDGIYMDDLTVHRADAVLWRAFAEGTHGSDVAALGGIRDRSSLALTAGRMKDDAVFRDAVHHFLRTFDRVFADFTKIATDGEIVRFADTRTARAFMLCARVAGTFD